MKRLNFEINKRVSKKWKNDPRRNKNPNFRWTDANRWMEKVVGLIIS